MEMQVLSASSTATCDLMEYDNSAVPLVCFLVLVFALEDQAGVLVNLLDKKVDCCAQRLFNKLSVN